ncbi:uncharacterized protein LOC133629758 [Entelurus aequoreus]|uniref:uncharacterized protein LOC133629758 n=1 Tax=Entelurus aequoreus TaxID=161455 RepID=UPI002B1D3FA5|nr:uncharacterized protein LOC133629758 [Entelurus aequoreus]XP_061876715.1 uncharacterized protein LOC133629758 [Entelurus aequoreus]XP_061876716.1 uncharacterized protein LOC133629758 [Entelurus aequoreus]
MRITVACLALVTFLWPVVSRGDKDVWCRLNESCLLPANSTALDDMIIHWFKMSQEDIFVHSYYYNLDQLELQDKQFKNRTSLFKEHIKDGNFTLLLKNVVVADEGRYKCYVKNKSSTHTSFIKLHVEAAVTTINIQQDGNNLTCSSSGIYPKPQLTWSTEPLLPHALQNATKVDNGTGETLYSISGWLVVAGDNTSQVDYICHVRSHSSRRLTWKNGSTVSFSGSETVINCPFLTGERSVVWMFNNRTIVKMSDGAKNISEEWKEQMKDVSTSGSLSLHSLSSDHEGRYTCQVDNATETCVITFFLRMAGGDKDVWCRLNESCLLPANSTALDDMTIHWFKMSQEDIFVHSYYYNLDQLELQDKQFKNRTSLFKEHIKDGNFTLLLKNVVVADEGRYKLDIKNKSSNHTSFIKLHVEAAVTTINIQQDGNNLTCSSSGIYPKPQLTWSTEPLLPHALQNATKVDIGTGETLYSISGWLVVAGDNTSQVDYICHVRSHSSRRLTWKNGSTVSFSGSETVINCPFLTGERSIVWMFNNRTILKMSNGAKNISEEWKEQVKDVSTSGSLSLHSLSSDHEGRYTCQVDNATETRVINFYLRMAGGRSRVVDIVIGVLATLAVLAAVAFIWYKKEKGSRTPQPTGIEEKEMDILQYSSEGQAVENGQKTEDQRQKPLLHDS